jgi:hypothetical protein
MKLERKVYQDDWQKEHDFLIGMGWVLGMVTVFSMVTTMTKVSSLLVMATCWGLPAVFTAELIYFYQTRRWVAWGMFVSSIFACLFFFTIFGGPMLHDWLSPNY